MELNEFDPTVATKLADRINNKKNEIYSLRRRNQRKLKSSINITFNRITPLECCNENDEIDGSYGQNKVLVIKNKSSKKSVKEDKPKTAPLSKYRRKTANARERTRMREINSAFEHLRNCVPVSITGVETPSNNEKLTKITTLRLAMKYIRILSEILNKCEKIALNRNSEECNLSNNISSIINYQEIYNNILNDTVFKPTVTKPTGGRKELKKQNSPAATNKIKKASSKPRKKYTKKQEKIFNNINQITLLPTKGDGFVDVGMTPESDSDSYRFSETRVTPLTEGKQWPRQDNLNNLGLLLESDGESLELSEPCLSPFSHFDSLNPFNEFLHSGFNESSTLEIYLS